LEKSKGFTVIISQAKAMAICSRVNKRRAQYERMHTFTLNIAANLLEWKEEEWD